MLLHIRASEVILSSFDHCICLIVPSSAARKQFSENMHVRDRRQVWRNKAVHAVTACDAFRGGVVRIETYFSADGRIAARREWFIKDALTGEVLGRATR